MIQCFSKITSATTGGGTRFNHPFSSNLAWSITESTHRSPISHAGVFKNLRAQARTSLGGGNSRDISIYHNGSITSLAVNIVGTDTSINQNLVNTVTVAAGDTISIGSTASGTPTASAFNFAIEFESTTDFASVYGGSLQTLGATTVFHNIQAVNSTNGTALAVDDSETVWPIAGTMVRLDVRLATAPGATATRRFTLMLNGVAQDGGGGTPDTRISLTGTGSGAGITIGSSTFTLPLVAGDVISLRADVTAGSPAGTTWGIGVGFNATNANEFAICSSDQTAVSAVAVNYSGQNGTLHWDATESNIALIGNVTPFTIGGSRVLLSAADNGRTFQPRVSGVDTGPLITLAGGVTTAAGSGGPATITSANTWSFKTAPGTQTRTVIWGLMGQAVSADKPGPLTSNPLLRMALIHGGMVQ